MLAHVMVKIRPRNPLARIIYNPTKESSKPDAIFLLACTLCWRRDLRSAFIHWRGREVRPAHIAGVQSHFVGHHFNQMEPAAPRPLAERALPARLSQSAASAGYRHGRRSVSAQSAGGHL